MNAVPPSSPSNGAMAPYRRSLDPRWLRAILVATLAFGIVVHVIALTKGRAWLLDNVLTPPVDVALIVPMSLSAWGLWTLRKDAIHSGGLHRVAYVFLTAYMAISALVHFDTVVAWEVRYPASFPDWYSAVIVPLQVVLVVFSSRLRFTPRRTSP